MPDSAPDARTATGEAGPAQVPVVELNNGVRMPQFGLGVWQAEAGAEVEQAIAVALASGYRLIDTAAAYGNEQSVGAAIRASGVPRKDIFLTTKLWTRDHGYDTALRAFEASLERLDTAYVDLYLIHWPAPGRGKFVESWRALEKLYADERVRAIGVSNFLPHHLETLQEADGGWDVVPAVNQIEIHPHYQQLEVRQFCEEHDIRIESYSPLKRGRDVLDEGVIRELADKYGRTPAQIILRWHVQEGFIVIPKSVTPERIRQNIDVFDFALHEDDVELIRELNLPDSRGRTAPDPDVFVG